MKRIVMLLAAVMTGCATMESAPEAVIQPVDMNAVSDGEFMGSATYRGFTYQVNTRVENHRIADIQIVQNKNSRHGRKAEGVIPLILQRQSPAVDGVSGATLCSTGLKMAVVDSLRKAAPAQ